MTTALSPVILMEKATRALSAAQALLDLGDFDGACNRAYYAMFDAAHAALFASGVEKLNAPIKTHNGLIGMFGLHVIGQGHLAAEHGEDLNAVQRLRRIADYSGDFVSAKDATWASQQAEEFIAAIRAKFAMGRGFAAVICSVISLVPRGRDLPRMAGQPLNPFAAEMRATGQYDRGMPSTCSAI